MKKDFRILTEIGNLLNKEKNKPVKNIENEFKNNLFPLSLFAKKESFLNQKTMDYLNFSLSNITHSNTTFDSNPNITSEYNESLPSLPPVAKAVGQWGQEQKVISTSALANVKTRNDVMYQYLKTFSIFNKRKNGILIKYNQHIGYNFNRFNVSLNLRGVEPQINKSLKTNHYHLKDKIIIKPLLEKETKLNKVTNTLRIHKLTLKLNKLKSVRGLTGYNRSANNKLIKYSYKLLFYFFKSMYCLISKPVFLFTPDKVTIQLFYYLNIPKFKVFKWYSILNNNLIRQKWYSLRFKKKLKLDNLNIPKTVSDFSTSSKNYAFSSNFTFSKISNSSTFLHCPIAKALDGNDGDELFKLNNLKPVISYSNKEMINRVKLSWRIKKALFRLNKKRSKVKNNLFSLNNFNLFKVFSLKFKLICEILSNKFKKPVELQLIRIHHPFHDSNILVNLLSLNIRNKKFKTNVAIEKLYAKKAVKNLYDYSIKSVNFIPTFLSGIKIRIGGRLMREPIIPRITTKIFERGATSPGKVNFLDTATITTKNRKGSYTIKISSGQNFF